MPPTNLWALSPDNVIFAGNVVARLPLSPRRKPNGAGVLGALVRPVLHRVEPRPRPHVLLQDLLVRTLLLPAHPAQGVLHHLGPSGCPEFSCLSSREICSPTAPNHGHAIGMLRYLSPKKQNIFLSHQRVISHAVEPCSALLPLQDRSHLPGCQPANLVVNLQIPT